MFAVFFVRKSRLQLKNNSSDSPSTMGRVFIVSPLERVLGVPLKLCFKVTDSPVSGCSILIQSSTSEAEDSLPPVHLVCFFGSV